MYLNSLLLPWLGDFVGTNPTDLFPQIYWPAGILSNPRIKKPVPPVRKEGEIPGKQAMHIKMAVFHKICASIHRKCTGILAFARISRL